MSIASDIAMRFRRSNFGGGWTKILAQEIYLAFLALRDPQTGPITVDLGDGRPPLIVRADNALDPFGGFRLPDLDAPDLNRAGGGTGGMNRDNLGLQLNINNLSFTETQLPDPASNQGADQPRRFLRQRLEQVRHNTTMPGKVVSGSGTTYTLTLYPDGIDETGFDQAGVRQLQIDPVEIVPVDSWGIVTRIAKVELITTTLIEAAPGTGGEREIARTMNLRMRSNKFYVQFPVWL